MNLRCVARDLSIVSGREILPASLLHSNRIPVEALSGEPAINLEARMVQFLEAGERSFAILPFFIGPTGALLDYFPMRLEKLRKRYGKIKVVRAPFVYAGTDVSGSDVARMLADRVRETIKEKGLDRPGVILVDHGSPLETVTRVRNELSLQLKSLLGKEAGTVAPASMERREGAAYDFNEPLLERILREKDWSSRDVVIAMLFLSPGRHAGPGGDVAEICRKAEAEAGCLRTYMTGLLGTHPDIVPLLARRLDSATEEL